MFTMRNSLFPILVTGLLLSCKTSDQIQRDQLLENLSTQMVQIQKLTSEQSIRLNDLEMKFSRITGLVEEKDYKVKITEDQQSQKLREELELLRLGSQTNTDQLKKTQDELAAQKQYMEKVIATLGKMSSAPASASSAATKRPAGQYDEAMEIYRKGQYAKAISPLTALLADKKIQGDQKARVYHNLGMSYFLTGKNEDTIVAFSKLLSEHPQYRFNANAMLHLGQAFSKLKQSDAAKETFLELIKRYPKSKQVQSAQKFLKDLK